MIAANPITDKRAHWRAWIWLCPWAMLGLAVGILFLLGLSVWTALLAAVLLACPTLILWGAIQVRRRQKRF
jgi:uncharacterized membrane protein YfcA